MSLQTRPHKPRLAAYGNSFAVYGGKAVEDGIPKGQVERDKLHDTPSSEGIELTKFQENSKDFILARLGHPVVRVELVPFQIKTCLDEALAMLHHHAPASLTQFAAFEASANINVYELPPYILDNLTYVVYRKSLLTIQQQAGTLEFDFFIKYFQDNFLFQDGGVADFFLLQQHLEMVRKILGQEGSWDVINNQYLQLHPIPRIDDVVILEYRAIDTDTLHPHYKSWIQRYGLACAKELLGQIRGKYQTVPSPGGGAVLNGQALIQESVQDKKILVEELINGMQEPPRFTAY